MSSTSPKRQPASAAILLLSLELAAVGIFTLLAGASDQAGTIVVLMMVGFWMIFLIQESGLLPKLTNGLIALTENPLNE